jgi:hypothetical protein
MGEDSVAFDRQLGTWDSVKRWKNDSLSAGRVAISEHRDWNSWKV